MIQGANDRIRLGVIGVNGRGRGISSCLSKLPECEVVCICDVDTLAMESCIGLVRDITGKAPRGEKDLRKVMEAPDIDGVLIATPDHWHVPAAIMAMRAGKHVYLEKPMSHSPAENEILLQAEAKYGVVVQGGNQRRSWPNVVAAIEEVRSGAIGEVRYAKGWYTKNRESIGIGKVVPVPEHLEWELWQGPAPREEYRDNIVHYNWHWFKNWGGGEFLNNGMHFVDLLRWGLGVEYPTKVDSVGGRYCYEDDFQFPDTQVVSYQYGSAVSCWMESRSCNLGPVEGYSSGVGFYGTKGNLFLSGGNIYKICDYKGKIIKNVKSNLDFTGSITNPSEALDAFHFRNWFDGIRKGAKQNSPLREACMSTQLAQLGAIAQQVGHSLEIDPQTGKILHPTKEIKHLWSRKYEKGWEPEV